jgi:hypothetical protein
MVIPFGISKTNLEKGQTMNCKVLHKKNKD